jgi:hypothetical protein
MTNQIIRRVQQLGQQKLNLQEAVNHLNQEKQEHYKNLQNSLTASLHDSELRQKSQQSDLHEYL